MVDVKVTELRNIIADRGKEGWEEFQKKYGTVEGLAKKLGSDPIKGFCNNDRTYIQKHVLLSSLSQCLEGGKGG